MLSGPDEFTLAKPLTRRQLMLRGGSAALAIGGAGVLAGCGGSSSSSSSSSSNAAATNPNKPISGTIHYFTYPGWIGNKEYARFEKLHPGVKIKEIAYNGSST